MENQEFNSLKKELNKIIRIIDFLKEEAEYSRENSSFLNDDYVDSDNYRAFMFEEIVIIIEKEKEKILAKINKNGNQINTKI